jgi:hypothetical protein
VDGELEKTDGGLAKGALAALIYAPLSLVYFGRGLFAAFTSTYLGQHTTDPSAFMWFLDWWPYALAHGENPLFTRLLWAPEGTTLAWSTPIPLPAIAALPVDRMFGPVAAYNVLCLAAPVLAALSAYLLCRWITDEFWPSVMGGFIFGFSPYMLGQILAHVDLVMVFPIPLAVLVALKYYSEETGTVRYVMALGALLVAQFLCFPELLATMTLFAGFAFAVALAVMPERRRVATMIAPTAVAYGVAAMVLSPYLYEMLRTRTPGEAIYSLSHFSADIANFVVPTTTNLMGLLPFARKISRTYTGLIYENGACLTLPLIVIAEAWRRERWREPEAKLLTLIFAVACVAALGPDLHVLGHHTFPMPWALLAHLPFVAIALPVRYALYAFLALSIIIAWWLAEGHASRRTKVIAASLAIVFLLPNPSAGFWVSTVDTPALIRDGGWRAFIEPGEIVLPLPYARYGNSMLWQATAQMSFRMASGYTSVTPFEFDRLPIVSFFVGAIDLPEAVDHLKAFIASKQVSAIVADTSDPGFEVWAGVLGSLGVTPIETGGVSLYRIRAGSFADYARLTPAQLEQRAVALRFDVLLEACAKYAAEDRPPGDFSPLALKRAHLLPPDWSVSTDPLVFHDYVVMDVSGRTGIAVGGSYEALRPLAERYHATATRIDYPYPRQWSPKRAYPTGDHRAPMLFEFDRSALAAAASQLAASPPPERTTPFPSAAPNLTGAKDE